MPNLQDYLQMLGGLNVNKSGDNAAPHKPCLLLAVIDLVESGATTDGRVRFTPGLTETFSEYFKVVAKPRQHERAYYPFFHLQSEPFWTIKAKAGREVQFERMTTPSSRRIEDNIECAEIDPELFKYLQNPVARNAIREHLVRAWFPDFQEALSKKVAIHRESNGYERALRDAIAGESAVCETPADPAVRDGAFRRVVLEAYDYRCAASGWRLIVPENRVLVQAAHLIPYSESQDDDPRNGIALTPNFHWALDKHVIAPGPDMKWHVSKLVDERISDNHPLLALEGKAVMTPRKQSLLPRKDALEWRMEHLR